MACAGCGLETSADFAFCPRCGRRLPAPCTACGAPCEPDFAFCPRCGAARSPAAVGADKAAAAAPVVQSDGREAHRRPVTVPFADLSGFTSLSERLDPEGGRAFQNAPFAPLAPADERDRGLAGEIVGGAGPA